MFPKMEVPQIMQNVLYIYIVLKPLVFGIPIFQETSRALCATNAWVNYNDLTVLPHWK